MKWYFRTGIILGCGFLLGAESVNLMRVILVETSGPRVLPHVGVWIFMLVIIVPVVLKSKEWFS